MPFRTVFPGSRTGPEEPLDPHRLDRTHPPGSRRRQDGGCDGHREQRDPDRHEDERFARRRVEQ